MMSRDFNALKQRSDTDNCEIELVYVTLVAVRLAQLVEIFKSVVGILTALFSDDIENGLFDVLGHA